MAKFEWIDDSGLRHPSLVYLDITNIPDTAERYRLDVVLEQAKILKVKRIDSFDEAFERGRLNRHKVRLRGYEFWWYDCVMNDEHYAVFAAFVKKEG